MLNDVFDLCTPMTYSSEIAYLINWIDEGYSYMAMTNYP